TESVILGHGPTLEEFTRSILYLWEAKSVTGQLLAIDGGQHLAWETRDVTGIE
ncbi:MAG: short-chain dehydrogenase, partial [Parvibaculum sp.]|nr:short-chain dehydrogenase [Parvibaculum sp.]